MNTTRTMALAGISVAALVIGAMPALAQQAAGADKPIEEIRVVAPRIVMKKEHLPFGTEQVTMSYAVSYADLDLTSSKDAGELKSRVRQAAAEICQDLDNYFPGGGEPPRDVCVRDATQKGLSDAQRAIDSAMAQR